MARQRPGSVDDYISKTSGRRAAGAPHHREGAAWCRRSRQPQTSAVRVAPYALSWSRPIRESRPEGLVVTSRRPCRRNGMKEILIRFVFAVAGLAMGALNAHGASGDVFVSVNRIGSTGIGGGAIYQYT